MISYLIDHGLGSTSKEVYAVARKYQLGYVGKPLTGDEWLQGTLVIPYSTAGGVKAIKFRRFGDASHAGKYIQHEGQKTRLYNTNVIAGVTAKSVPVVGLTEGEIDAITATERLGVPTVGFPGADTWQKNAEVWAGIFKNFPTALIFSDGDKDGRRVASLVRTTLGWGARIISCPTGEDVSSMVAQGRAQELKDKIKEVLSGEE